MTTYLIDSDVLMDFFKKKDYALTLLEKLIKRGSLAISILSIVELRAGWNNEQKKFLLPRLYKLVAIKNLTTEIAELAGEFRYKYKAKGVSLPTIDSLIAATAIIEKCKLVTRNKKDFPMPEVTFYHF